MIKEIQVFAVENGKALKARANVTFSFPDGSEITQKGFRVHDQEGKPPWVGAPSERYAGNKFKETVELNPMAKSVLFPLILEKYIGQLKNKT